jgi:hypothetical protein
LDEKNASDSYEDYEDIPPPKFSLKQFKYMTIPTILQNIDNNNFNIRVWNQHYLPKICPTERPDEMNIFTEEEFHLVVERGIQLMQEYPQTHIEAKVKSIIGICVNKYWHHNTWINSATWKINHPSKINDTYLWNGDSGASCHLINSDEGMFNTKRIHSVIGIGDGKIAVDNKENSVTLTVHQRNGDKSIVTLCGCKYLPGLSNSLFSITKAISNWSNLCNKRIYYIVD